MISAPIPDDCPRWVEWTICLSLAIGLQWSRDTLGILIVDEATEEVAVHLGRGENHWCVAVEVRDKVAH
jgi:hypothetical protein